MEQLDGVTVKCRVEVVREVEVDVIKLFDGDVEGVEEVLTDVVADGGACWGGGVVDVYLFVEGEPERKGKE